MHCVFTAPDADTHHVLVVHEHDFVLDSILLAEKENWKHLVSEQIGELSSLIGADS